MGSYVAKTGYVLTNVRRDQIGVQMMNANGYLHEHRLVMARSLGRPLSPREQVHHKNGIKTDNRIENLELIAIDEHTRRHAAEKIRWSRLRDECERCGSSTSPHAGRGICRACYQRELTAPRRKYSRRTGNPLLAGEWSRKFRTCQKCGSSKRRHTARGLCSACYHLAFKRNEL